MILRLKGVGFAAFSMVFSAALCGALVAKADQQPPATPASESASSLPKVDAGADPSSLERRVDAYVRAISRHPGVSDEDALIRWNTPICPLVLGFATSEVKPFSDRLSQFGVSVGAPLARSGCQPNFIIVATSEPDRVLEAWYARDKRLFRDASPAQIHHFMESSRSRPVRVWYNIDTGRKSGVHNGHFVPSNTQAESSAFAGNTVFDFFSVFAIIDTHKTGAVTPDELAAYVALAGLSNVDLDADLVGAPSILHLFAPSGDQQASELSPWDSAFLKALYQSNQTSRTRRFDITERMIHDLSR